MTSLSPSLLNGKEGYKLNHFLDALTQGRVYLMIVKALFIHLLIEKEGTL